MDNRMLSTIALIAGFLAVVGGVWGLVEGTDGNDPDAIAEALMWVALDLVLLGVAAVCLALASRSDR